jgi:hypothetical protein
LQYNFRTGSSFFAPLLSALVLSAFASAFFSSAFASSFFAGSVVVTVVFELLDEVLFIGASAVVLENDAAVELLITFTVELIAC